MSELIERPIAKEIGDYDTYYAVRDQLLGVIKLGKKDVLHHREAWMKIQEVLNLEFEKYLLSLLEKCRGVKEELQELLKNHQ